MLRKKNNSVLCPRVELQKIERWLFSAFHSFCTVCGARLISQAHRLDLHKTESEATIPTRATMFPVIQKLKINVCETILVFLSFILTYDITVQLLSKCGRCRAAGWPGRVTLLVDFHLSKLKKKKLSGAKTSTIWCGFTKFFYLFL